MMNYEYSLSVFNSHLKHSCFNLQNSTIVEIGPGDSISTGIMAWVMGAKKTILIDNGDYATKDFSIYKHLLLILLEQGYEKASILLRCNSLDEILEVANIAYLIDGLKSIQEIKSDSVDFCFSQAVLEHVFKDEINEYISELYRIQKHGGLCSHKIDLKDHMGGGLNSLRFSSKIWEKPLLKRAGFYTNRIRSSYLIQTFENVGFKVIQFELSKWKTLPIKRHKLAKEFMVLPQEELLISGLYVLCKK